MRKERGKKPRRRSIPLLQWLGEAGGRDARVTVVGASRALVENHLGVRDYTETHLSLLSGRGAIEITGDALLLPDVRKGALIVSGKIYRVELTDA